VIVFTRYLSQDDTGPGFEFHETCGSLFRVSAAGHSVRRLTNPPWKDSFHSHSGPSVSPDGRRVAFTDANQCSGGTTSFAARVVDLAGRATSDLALLRGNAYFPVEPEYGAPAWSPDGTRMALIGDGLEVVRASGAGRRQLTPPGFRLELVDAAGPAWSPDGRWIAFSAYGRTNDPDTRDLYVIRPDGSGLRRLTRTPADESSPSWIRRMPRTGTGGRP
jgi:TolB protein